MKYEFMIRCVRFHAMYCSQKNVLIGTRIRWFNYYLESHVPEHQQSIGRWKYFGEHNESNSVQRKNSI